VKDKRIADLKEIENSLNETIFGCRNKIENLEAALDEKTAALEALTAEMNQLKSDAAEVAGALAARGCESVKQLCDTLDETSGALSKTKAALDAETKRYREQVGSAMTQPENLPTLQEGLAKCATPAEKSAFIASGKYRKN
jgi:ABC-type transporter Mla subunit MlaD